VWCTLNYDYKINTYDFIIVRLWHLLLICDYVRLSGLNKMESYRENIGKQCKAFKSSKSWVFYFIAYAGYKMSHN